MDRVKLPFDMTKAQTELEHKYILNIPENDEIEKEENKVYVICKYLTDPEYERYLTNKLKGDNAICADELFRSQVLEIHNLLHPTEDRDVTIDELKAMKMHNDFIYALKIDVVRHLIDSTTLTEEEKGN